MSGGSSRFSSSRDHSPMRRVVGVVTILLWVSAALLAAWVMLSWVASGVRDERSFLYLGAALLVLAMVSSAFLLWQELRASRREWRAVRRESRDIRVEEGGEWTPKAWLYATAFGLSFFVSWYLLPALLLSS
jgi:protein-S-isoprenylcysteine O-methyltransferase Ste14